MGSQVQKQAALLGLTKLRITTLYAQPRRFRMTAMKYVPDIADIIRDYINIQDPSFIQDRSGGGKNNSYYYMSQQAQIYVEVLDKYCSNFSGAYEPQSRAIQINIFCDEEDHIRGITQAITLGEDRMKFLVRIVWKKIEGKFKVKIDDCIAEWKKWLAPSSAAEIASLLASRPPALKRQTAWILQIIFNITAVLFFVIWGITIILGIMYLIKNPYMFSGVLVIFFGVYFWVAIGCVIAGGIFGYLKRKAAQYLLSQRLLSEEKQQQEIAVNIPSSAQYSTAVSASVAPPLREPTDTIFCNQCGFRNPKGAHFCKNCGSAIG